MTLVKLKTIILANYCRKPHPCYATPGSAGFDLRVAEGGKTRLFSGGAPVVVPTGLAFEVPEGYELQIRPRSGLSLEGVVVINSPGTIDSDYRGEVKVLLRNVGPENINLRPGDRIAQAVLAPVVQAQFEFVDALSETERGAGGFGSTGKD